MPFRTGKGRGKKSLEDAPDPVFVAGVAGQDQTVGRVVFPALFGQLGSPGHDGSDAVEAVGHHGHAEARAADQHHRVDDAAAEGPGGGSAEIRIIVGGVGGGGAEIHDFVAEAFQQGDQFRLGGKTRVIGADADGQGSAGDLFDAHDVTFLLELVVQLCQKSVQVPAHETEDLAVVCHTAAERVRHIRAGHESAYPVPETGSRRPEQRRVAPGHADDQVVSLPPLRREGSGAEGRGVDPQLRHDRGGGEGGMCAVPGIDPGGLRRDGDPQFRGAGVEVELGHGAPAAVSGADEEDLHHRSSSAIHNVCPGAETSPHAA